MNMKKLLKRNEFYVILIIVVLSLLIQMKSGQFFTANNIVDLVRSLIVPGMMAAGLFMVIASGNIDVSFPYTAMLCMFAVTKWFQTTGYDGPVIVGFLAAGLLGQALNDSLCMQDDIYKQMSAKGWYQTEQAEQQKIMKVKNQFAGM